MSAALKGFVVLLFLTVPLFGSAQIGEEDVVVLKDGTVMRGTVPDTLSPGDSVSLRRRDGTITSLPWNGIAAIKRLPAGIPDSLIVQAFLGDHAGVVLDAPSGSPNVDVTGYRAAEDVLFLNDGAILRGVRLNEPIDGRTIVWANGKPIYVPESIVRRTERVERGTPDSVLVRPSVDVPIELTAPRRRIFSLFGGLAVPFNPRAKPENPVSRTFTTGFSVGVEAGVQLLEGLRWLSGISYSLNNRSNDPNVEAIDGAVAGSSKGTFLMMLTGGELRTQASSGYKVRMFALMGLLSYAEKGYEGSFPQSLSHLAGTIKADDASASSFAYCMGGGVIFGQLGVDVRWYFSKPVYASSVRIQYSDGMEKAFVTPERDAVNFILLNVSVSVF